MATALIGQSTEQVKELSERFSEPEEVTKSRFNALQLFNLLPVEKSPLYMKYVDLLSGLKLDNLVPAVPHRPRVALPEDLKKLLSFEDAFLFVHVDSDLVHSKVPSILASEGLVWETTPNIFKEHPELASLYFSKAVGPEEDKFAALNYAFLGSGLFVYVPKNLKINVPLRNMALLRSRGLGVFAHNVIIAEAGSKITFLEEAYSRLNSDGETPSLCSTVTEVFLGEGAEVSFSSIQNLGTNVFVTTNRRSIGDRDSQMKWTVGHVGAEITRSRMDTVLSGPGASAEDVEIVFGAGNQRFDVVTDVTHRSQNTTGSVLARGVLRDRSRSIFKGMIRMEKGAKNSNSYLAEHAMLLSREARADAIPGLEIATNEVKATHSGSVAQIDEEAMFYLRARGLDESLAKKMMILGFLHPVVRRIPMRRVRLGIQFLIEEKWAGRLGGLPPPPEELPTLEEEPEEKKPVDLFERHYKYR